MGFATLIMTLMMNMMTRAGECFWKIYDKNDDKYTMTLKANGFGKEGLRRVATLHLPTPLVVLIIFGLMQKTMHYHIVE